MVWAKLDDAFFSHPKAVRAGIEGRALFVACVCYSAGRLTDGYVEEAMLPVLGAMAGVRNVKKVAEQLATLGLFEVAEGGFTVHDFLEYNPSRESVLADREARSAAGRVGGMKSGIARRSKNEASAEASASPKWGENGSGSLSKREANAEASAEANAQALAQAKTNPVSRIPLASSKQSDFGVETPPSPKPPRRPRGAVVPLTDEERASLEADYRDRVPNVREEIDLALSHEAHRKYPTNQRGYVAKWLQRASEFQAEKAPKSLPYIPPDISEVRRTAR